MAKWEKETFKSYVNQYVDDQIPSVGKTTRKEDRKSKFSLKHPRTKRSISTNSTCYFQMYDDPLLLPGERVIGQAENVLRFSSFTAKKQGISGALYVTNFKITFVTAERTALNTTRNSNVHDRNFLLNDVDVPLVGIDAIYQGFSGGKRKKIVPGTTVSNKTKYLYVHCKNLRVHQYSFKFTPKDQDKQIMNAIVAFAFPNRPELLFALQYAQQNKFTDVSTPKYTSKEDWDTELTRLGCQGWRTIPANQQYTLCSSLPEFIVIPHSIVVAELREASQYYVDNRPPIWCYSTSNGASLVKAAYVLPDTDYNELNNKFFQAMANLTLENPLVFDMGKMCPNVHDLHQNFEKLKELLVLESLKDFWSTDIGWYTSIENTHWLEGVQACLRVASRIVQKMSDVGKSVIIKENSSRDITCVVSCLVQILLDSHYRTITGFQSLIQKEWVSLGHPFQSRNNIIKYDQTQQSPVFLLFLDCVWQLTQQFTSHFEFTDTYLVSLWDSVHVGLFENFLFDSNYERDKLYREFYCGSIKYTAHLPSAFDWQLQYDAEHITLFKNPLYFVKTSTVTKTSSVKLSTSSGYALALNRRCSHTTQNNNANILQPNYLMSTLKLWCLCYFRWLAPVEIINGGCQFEYLQQCLLVEDILSLRQRLNVLTKQSTELTKPDSNWEFGGQNTSVTSRLLQSTLVTSSFPYSPSSPRGQQSYVFTPTTNHLTRSSTNYEDCDD